MEYQVADVFQKVEIINASPQVLVLELETRLQKERERLGELRKKHYELAGVAEGWGEEEEGEHRCFTKNAPSTAQSSRLIKRDITHCMTHRLF